MLKPKVSIITVVYNAKEALAQTVDNIKQLQYENLDYIIVDGGSTDGTLDVIKANDEFVTKWISEPDKGLYDAMNKALSMVKDGYVWFINAGDFVYSKDLLVNIFAGFENYSDIYYGDTVIKSQEGKVMGLRRKKLPKRLSHRSYKYGMVVCHQSFIVRREIAPYYDLSYKYASDIDWVMECTRRARRITNTRYILSTFVEGGISTASRYDSLKERWEIMVKHYGYIKAIYYHLLITSLLFTPKYRRIKKPY